MTEAEWLAADDPTPMLQFLRGSGKLSERKARLFSVACCRRVWPLIGPGAYRAIVDLAERAADGEASREELRAAELRAYEEAGLQGQDPALWAATHTAGDSVVRWPSYYPEDACHYHAARAGGEATERPAQAALLRDLFGPVPFRPVAVSAAGLAWNDGTVRRLAEAIYAERAFERMPILADAFEEAGFDGAEIVAHCRQRGALHVRGCWVMDLLSGRE